MQEFVVGESWPRSTSVRVRAEASRLWTLLTLVPPLNQFGDDNQEAIEAQLSVITEGLTVAETVAEFDNACTERYVLCAALTAVKWLWEGGEAPSDHWLRVASRGITTYSIN